MNRLGSPVIVGRECPGTNSRALTRLRLREAIDEAWLQRLIDACPQVLPVGEVDPRVHGSLFSLGREIPTPAGAIDNVLLSESGQLIVVETKLWRSPEARRQVVAQLLDYAGHVRNWTYSSLSKLWAARHGDTPGMWATVGAANDEAAWVDCVESNLEAGRMTLLVVGDGIDSRAETLADSVSASPDFQFRLALVELRLYDANDGQVLVIPSSLARTREIERATVRVVYEGQTRPAVKVEVPRPASTANGGRSRTTLDASSFLAALEESGVRGKQEARVVERLLEAIDERPELTVEWTTAGFVVKTPDPMVEGAMMSLAVVNPPVLYTYSKTIEDRVVRYWGNKDAAERLGHALRDAFVKLGGRVTSGGRQVNLNLTNLDGREEDVIRALTEVVEAIAREASGSEG